MGELFWMYTIVISIILIFSIAIRHRVFGWGWNFLVIVLVIYAALFKLTGTPRDAWMFSLFENQHGEMEVVYHINASKKFIYLMLRKGVDDQPYYLRLPWSKEVQDQLDSAMMKAQEEGVPLMVDLDQLSKGKLVQKTDSGKGNPADQDSNTGEHGGGEKEGGEAMFYPKPTLGDPLKMPVQREIKVE